MELIGFRVRHVFAREDLFNIEASIITHTILWVPYYIYSIAYWAPKPYSNYYGPYIRGFASGFGRLRRSQPEAKGITIATECSLLGGSWDLVTRVPERVP